MTHSTSARPFKFYRGSVAVFTVMLVLCGCAMRKAVAPEFYAAEEKRMSALIKNTSDFVELSDWLVERARLRVRAGNPQPDYSGALKDFTASLSLNPKRRDGGDVRDWIAVLSKLADIELEASLLESQNKAVLSKLANIEQLSIGLKSQYIKARQQNLSLKSIIARLKIQEMELRKSIEDLQALELEMEQRRLQLR